MSDFNPKARSFEAPVPYLASILGRVREAIAPQAYVLGCDISHWNSTVDFRALKAAGFEFVILKATESTNYIDPTFAPRWRQALDAGLLVGAYHFFRSNCNGADQADYYLDAIRPLLDATGGKIIPPANDIETADGATVANRKTQICNWYAFIHATLNMIPLTYSSQYLWSLLTGNMTLDCVGWSAHWYSGATPLWPYGWPADKRLFWQFGVYPKHSWVPPVPGVTGECDVNRFLGTLDELRAFVGLAEPTNQEKLDILWERHPEFH